MPQPQPEPQPQPSILDRIAYLLTGHLSTIESLRRQNADLIADMAAMRDLCDETNTAMQAMSARAAVAEARVAEYQRLMADLESLLNDTPDPASLITSAGQDADADGE